jgi:hypothetical protein
MCVFLADSPDGDGKRMRTCPKCGRQNQPTRKYCTRCGALLLSVEQKPKTISSPSETHATSEQQVPESPPPTPSASEIRVTTNDEWVKPSQVSRDRVRSSGGTTKPKSEMEKAREAFAKADKIGIEDEGEGIIETRMLRASEVQELMGDLERQKPVAEPQQTISPPASQAPMGPPSGTAGLPPGAAPSAQPSSPPKVAPQAPPVQQSKPTPMEKPVGMAPSPEPKPTMSAPSATQPPTPKRDVPSKARIPKVDALMSEIADSEFLKDTIIRDSFNDLTNQYTELAQFKTDLNSVSSRMESEVQDYWNLAEVKRINFESLEEQTRLAKQEWTDSSKVYQTAKKRLDNETSSREKRIKDLDKRIEKTEDSIRKRIKELEKEKEKRESLA